MRVLRWSPTISAGVPNFMADQRGSSGPGCFHSGARPLPFRRQLCELVVGLERIEQIEVLLKQANEKKSFQHGLSGLLTEPLTQRFVFDQLDDPFGGLRNRRDQKSVVAVLDLVTNTARVAPDD